MYLYWEYAFDLVSPHRQTTLNMPGWPESHTHLIWAEILRASSGAAAHRPNMYLMSRVSKFESELFQCLDNQRQ